MNADTFGYVPVATVERSGFTEGVHFGRLIALNADGSDAFTFGDVDAPIHPRSTNKLMQATGMRELGLTLEGELLALSASSHWGEPMHIDGVRKILARERLDESSLQTTPGFPQDADARRSVIREGVSALPILHDCSGKHAAMVVTTSINGWNVASYLDPKHQLQQQLRATVESCIGQPVAHTAVDGCGAPAFAMPLRSLANAYRAAVLAPPGSALRHVADAMRAHPQYVGGEESEVTHLMRAVPGLLVKDGAESVYVAAFDDGRAAAVKVADGGYRAGQAVLVAALRALGVSGVPGADASALARLGDVPVLGHGHPVGRVRAQIP
jgi:L-asparaginase II